MHFAIQFGLQKQQTKDAGFTLFYWNDRNKNMRKSEKCDAKYILVVLAHN